MGIELIRYKRGRNDQISYFFLGAAFLAGFLAAFLAGFLAAFLAGFFAAFLAGFLAAFFGFLAFFAFFAFLGFFAFFFFGFFAFFFFATLANLKDPDHFPDFLAGLRVPLASPRLRARRAWTAVLAASTL